MNTALDESRLADVLPGTWTIAATNLPMWLNGERLDGRLSYELISSDPLVLSDDVAYRDPQGEEKHIVGENSFGRDRYGDEGFRWRGKGMLKLVPGRWAVSGFSEDGAIAVIRFEKSLATAAGIDVIVREGADEPEVRKTIARATEEFGLTPEDFGSLTWL